MCRRPVILALGRLRLDVKFEASPDYTSTKPAWVAENDLAGGDAGRGGHEGGVYRVCAEMAKTKNKLTNKIPQDDV